MKSINEIINKNSPERLTELAHFFNLKKKTERSVTMALCSIPNLHAIFQTLSKEELKILKLVYSGNDGITFGEIEKHIKINPQQIDVIAGKLSQKLLIHVIKNRQLLHKKLDKIYAITELAALITISTDQNIIDHLQTLSDTIAKDINNTVDKKISNQETTTFIQFLFECGCIASFQKIKKKFHATFITEYLQKLYDDNIIHIYFNIDQQFEIYVVPHESTICQYLKQLYYGDGNKTTCYNGFQSLNNILYCFDTISTFGLFLTKQNEFRKIDKRRIKESLIPLTNSDGALFSSKTTSALALYCLSNLGCIHLEKDITHTTLTPISQDLNNPLQLLKTIIDNFSTVPPVPNFEPPFYVPEQAMLDRMISSLSVLQKVPINFFNYYMQISTIINSPQKSLSDKLHYIKNNLADLESLLDLLTAFGVIALQNGSIVLSPIGKKLFPNSAAPQEYTLPPAVKNIYINPDFTIMAPKQDQSETILYNLLAYTEIIKNDVVLHLSINRDTVMKSQKREMPIQELVDILKITSKNEIPQNLEFQLHEWSKQTLKINISENIVLQVNHQAFIDELIHGKHQDLVIERISPTHIIIDKNNIESIIKLGRKKEAIIYLFND